VLSARGISCPLPMVRVEPQGSVSDATSRRSLVYMASPYPRRKTLVALFTIAFLGTGPASAQPAALPASAPDSVILSLRNVQRLAITRSPAALADREDIAIASAGLRRARTIPFNPDISFQKPGAGGTAEAVATQELEILGQRGLRVSAARFGVGRATAGVYNARRLAVTEASAAFLRAVAAERRLAVTRDGLVLVERLLTAVRIQLVEGEISALEANLAEIELGRARARVLASQRDASTLLLELKRQTGLAPDTPVRLVVEPLGEDPSTSMQPRDLLGDTTPTSLQGMQAMALGARPDLAAAFAAVRELDALSALARREAFPNLRLGAILESGGGARRVGPVIGMSIPLFNRNQGLIAEREAQRRQAAFRQQAIELRVRTDVASALRAYQIATEESAVFEQSVRQPSHENAALLELAYRAGKIPLPTLLLLRNQLLDGELGYWDAWRARGEAHIQLRAATGTLPTFTAPTDTTVRSPR